MELQQIENRSPFPKYYDLGFFFIDTWICGEKTS